VAPPEAKGQHGIDARSPIGFGVPAVMCLDHSWAMVPPVGMVALAELAPERQPGAIIGAPGMNHGIPVDLAVLVFRQRVDLISLGLRPVCESFGTFAVHGGVACLDPRPGVSEMMCHSGLPFQVSGLIRPAVVSGGRPTLPSRVLPYRLARPPSRHEAGDPP